ncbi:ankyrin repeat domain-containing protein [Psychroserpens sp. AS72]|uniref:ankyrin repeat domain-containing protein n=1 Tax=Psychroserpens sp. AS72 TaxID=3135775 RepID=UPI0031813FDB
MKSNANDCFQLLLDEKVNLEKVCTSKTPLMYAVKYGRLDFVKSLVEAGAKLEVKNDKGLTALDYAKKYKQDEIATYLAAL